MDMDFSPPDGLSRHAKDEGSAAGVTIVLVA